VLKRIAIGASILAVAAHAAVLSAQPQVPGHQVSDECVSMSTPSSMERSPLYAKLLERRVPVEEVIRVDVSSDELNAPAAPGDRRLRVGAVKAANVNVEFAGLSAWRLTARALPYAHGAIRSNGAGGFEWTGVVRSDRATALRLHFNGFYLPRNAELYLSNDVGDVVGPYTGRGLNRDGEFWSHTLWGSAITLHLFYDGTDTDRVLGAARFAIAHVGHLDGAARVALSQPAPSELASNLCSYNDDCIKSAANASIPALIQPAQDAVAYILFASGPWLYICSGGLIADTDAGSDIPLFLTANHCISRGREANSLEAFFQYTSGCSGPVGSDVLGSSILASNRTGDYTLLRLNQQPPSDTVALQFSTTEVAFSNGTDLFRISHPSGAPQAYSTHDVDTSRATCSSWPRGSWIYSSDSYGGTEGGSSGSPVLNAAGKIVGQLSGACGYNVSDSCDSASNATVDGALASYYPEVASYLNPNTSCTDSDGDGFCAEGGADCDDSSPAINPNATEVCGDGLDNDCDGLVDNDDPICQVGSCDMGAKGDSCTTNSECCSNNCKGKAGAMSCR